MKKSIFIFSFLFVLICSLLFVGMAAFGQVVYTDTLSNATIKGL